MCQNQITRCILQVQNPTQADRGANTCLCLVPEYFQKTNSMTHLKIGGYTSKPTWSTDQHRQGGIVRVTGPIVEGNTIDHYEDNPHVAEWHGCFYYVNHMEWQYFFYECMGWTPTLGSLLYFHSFEQEGTEEVANNKRFQYEFCVGSCVSNIHSLCNLEIKRQHGNHFLWWFSAVKVKIVQSAISNLWSLPSPFLAHGMQTSLLHQVFITNHPPTTVLRNSQMDLKKSHLHCCYFYLCKWWLCSNLINFPNTVLRYIITFSPLNCFHILHMSD